MCNCSIGHPDAPGRGYPDPGNLPGREHYCPVHGPFFGTLEDTARLRLARFEGGELHGMTVEWVRPGDFPEAVVAYYTGAGIRVAEAVPGESAAVGDRYELVSKGQEWDHPNIAQGAVYRVGGGGQ